ncbi:hypothetical protein TRVA0_003S01794 [Trichomonascus vanleenenianus]|uniref:Cti6p n=1 Tax=Trichomonascus vanleenenianus TaxID=2268995 RepID=UPI003EC9CC90
MVQRRTRPRSSASSSTERQRPRRPRRRTGEDEELEINDENEMELDEEEEEEELEEEGGSEVTRCICGHQDLPAQTVKNSKVEVDTGLFIQCDLCHVWQHGCCVGFSSEDEVPDVYTCEKCRPERHVVVVRPWGKTSTYYPDGAPDCTKEKATPQAAQTMGVTRGSNKRKSRSPSPQRPETQDTNGKANGASRRAERRQRATLNSRDYEETLQRVLDESLHDLDNVGGRPAVKAEGSNGKAVASGGLPESSSDERTLSSSSRKSKRTPRVSRKAAIFPEEIQLRAKEEPETPANNNNNAPGSNNDTDTSTLANNSTATPSKKKRSRPRQRKAAQPKSAGGTANNKNPDSYQESKPRIPPPRATIPELRRRVAAILEFVSRTRDDAELEQQDRTRLLEERNKRHAFLYPNNGVVPSGFPAMFEKYQATIEGMEHLTTKLSRWEELYGSYDASTSNNDTES